MAVQRRFRLRCMFGFHRWSWERVLLPGLLEWAYLEICRDCEIDRTW